LGADLEADEEDFEEAPKAVIMMPKRNVLKLRIIKKGDGTTLSPRQQFEIRKAAALASK